MFQTKILVTFSISALIPLTVDSLAQIEILKTEGKTDGVLIIDPPYNEAVKPLRYWIKEEYAPSPLAVDSFQPYLARNGLRTWINRTAAEEWISWWNGKCTEYGHELPTSEIIEIV